MEKSCFYLIGNRILFAWLANKIRAKKAVLFVAGAAYKVTNVSLTVTRCALGMLSHTVTVMMTQRSASALCSHLTQTCKS